MTPAKQAELASKERWNKYFLSCAEDYCNRSKSAKTRHWKEYYEQQMYIILFLIEESRG